MRRLLLALACVLVLASAVSGAFIRSTHRGALNHRLTDEQLYGPSSEGDAQPKYFTQKLDHQDLTSTVTFQQRYFVNASSYTGQGPVFLIIGGEGPISPAYVSDHFAVGQYAVDNGALLLAIEHRFYGETIPGNDSSTANLRYLSSAQALEDLVSFRQYIVQELQIPSTSKWIVFGGSYSGSLSAWARLKYPQLFAGSFAASAPLQAQLEFAAYFETVAASVGPTCDLGIAAANVAVAKLLQTSAGVSQLVSDFNLCAAPAGPNDIINFLGDLSGPISGIVQYNLDNNNYEMYPIPTMCSVLETAPTPYQGLLDIWNQQNNFSGQTGCTDISYSGFISSMQGTSDGRSWTWQTCTEFGYFQTGSATDQPFSPLISLQSFLDQCQDIFGIAGLTPSIDWINSFYGGDAIVATNTVFTMGSIDPWTVLATKQQFAPPTQSLSIQIEGTAHCADLYPPRASDLPGLVSARQAQAALLAQWLSDSPKEISLQ